MDSSSRPRLGEHVVARRHFVDGEERVVLHDTKSGRLVVLGAREWGLLAPADGTRDLEGIVLAAARDGWHAKAAALSGFLDQLEAAGMLGPEPAPEPALAPDPDRPVEALPGFSLVCDGSGSCCRLYGTVLFAPIEAARARSLLPDVLDADRHERVFLPERGSAPIAGAAVALTNGRCVYLADSGRCRLHALGGPGAKPAGCSVYPAQFVDDGESVRVSPAVECACVLASAGRDDGAPLVAASAKRRADLDARLSITHLPESIPLGPGSRATRVEAVAWSRRVARSIEAWSSSSADPAAALAALADRVAAVGLAHDVDAAMRDPPALDPSRLSPWIEALSARAARRAREDAAWRSERDLARRATAWIAAAASRLRDDHELAVAMGDRARRPDEVFYLRALVHGHGLFLERPLTEALLDCAVRVLVARSLRALFEATPVAELDPACRHPLALVEAMLRAHGLGAYVDDVSSGRIRGA